MVKGWVTLLSSEISFLIYKFKGAGDRGVRRLAAADHSPPTGNKSENACRHTFHARIELRSNKKKSYKLLHK
jgi:hypothetical protein